MDLKRYWSPQWLYKEKVLMSAYGDADLPSSYFRNITPYPLEMHWLAVTGLTALAETGTYSVYAGLPRTFRMNLAISSEGDINYIRTLGGTLMAPTHAYRFHQARYAVGNCLKFEHQPVIPADAGLEVSARHPGNAWAYPEYNYLSALFNGYTYPAGEDNARNPHHLACVGPAAVQPNGIYPFDCADLQNDGKLDLHLVEMILNDVKDPVDGTYGIGSLQIEWLVNPTTGPMWMPGGKHIPLGNICPFDDPQYGLAAADIFGGSGAWVFEFPPKTMLMPRQRLGVNIRDISGVSQSINMSLFGYLEVS